MKGIGAYRRRRSVSGGCIRLGNEDIASPVPLLSFGRPVDIVDGR